jgi:hypothetical protein
MTQQQLDKRPPFAERLDDGAVRIWAPRPSLCSGEGATMTMALPFPIGPAQKPVDVPNGDFSIFEGDNGFAGWETDGPGVRTFRDEEVFATGNASLRMEFSPGCGRILALKFIDLPVKSALRLVMRLRTRDLADPRKFTTLVYNGRTKFNGGVFGRARQPLARATMDWTEVGIPLDVGETPEAMIAIGSWSLEGGTAWLDEVRIERGGGGCPTSMPVGYDSRFVAPRTLSNPDFYLWYRDRLAEVRETFPNAHRWVLATDKGDGSPLAEDMRLKALALAANMAGDGIVIEEEDA